VKKISVSLEDDLWKRADDRAAQVAGGNVSLLTAVALRRALEMPVAELRQLTDLERFDRWAPTRSAWMQAYWYVLARLMGRPQMDVIENPYAPRHFGEFFAVLLLNHVARNDDENDPFIPHIGPMPVTAASPPPVQWTFDRSSSPVAAAETVAAKLIEYGVAIETPPRG
jgi:hypothetical protein